MPDTAELILEVKSDARDALSNLRALVGELRAVRFARQYWPEVLTAAAFVAGWLLITAGVAAIADALPWWIAAAVARAVWRVSLGGLALSLGGWKLLRQFVVDGLYSLAKGK